MASVHNLPDMPLPKDVFLAKEITRMAPKLSESDKITWSPEVEWYLETLAVVGKDMRLSLCHNDVNQNNILIPDEYPEQLVLIDYEYTGNDRATVPHKSNTLPFVFSVAISPHRINVDTLQVTITLCLISRTTVLNFSTTGPIL